MHLAFWDNAILGLLVVHGGSASFNVFISLNDEIENVSTLHGTLY